ncbi:MAG: diphthine--ammonia ligase [Calditrichaeota bacterium]|nr:diphthine--ammonia ligase [Calditrichota bacterium]
MNSFFNWSGGKDSALALYHVLNSSDYQVIELLTTISLENQRISMHGVRLDLLKEQASSLNLPLKSINLPQSAGVDEYNRLMEKTLAEYQNNKIDHAIFGDIFLEDLRRFREENLAKLNIKAVFPLWKKDTKSLIREFIDFGFKAITVAVDAKLLDRRFAGRIIDEDFLTDLPANVDPCGENGEFHSFVFDGPIFTKSVPFKIGEIVERSYSSGDGNWHNSFYFCDLLPATEPP